MQQLLCTQILYFFYGKRFWYVLFLGHRHDVHTLYFQMPAIIDSERHVFRSPFLFGSESLSIFCWQMSGNKSMAFSNKSFFSSQNTTVSQKQKNGQVFLPVHFRLRITNAVYLISRRSGLTFTPGPMVDATTQERTYWPFAAAGLARRTAPTNALKFSWSFSAPKDTFPIGQ